MNQEIDAKQTALDPEDAARMPAGTRDHGMGAAALNAMRRQAETMKKLRLSDSRTGLLPVRTSGNALSASADAKKPASPPSCRRAALRQALGG